MVITKLSRKEWAYTIEKGLRKQKIPKHTEDQFWGFINEHRLIPLAIGVLACAAVIKIWGLLELMNMLLSWIIGIVVVTTLIAGVLHPSHPNGKKR